MKIMTLKHIMLLLTTIVLLSGCAIQEIAIEDPIIPKNIRLSPCLVEGLDYLKNDLVVSSIQKSPLYILKGYTYYKDGCFQIDVPVEDSELLGLSEREIEEYRKTLNDL